MKNSLTIIGISMAIAVQAQFDDKFYYPSKEWSEISICETADFSFQVEKDTINVVLFKPVDPPKATVLFFHGAGGNVSTYTDYLAPLVNNGFLIYAVDFRGYGRSTGIPTHLNIASDGQLIFDSISKITNLLGVPLVIYGISMGTPVATHLAKGNLGEYQLLVLDGTISSFTDLALLSAPDEQKMMIKQYVTSPYSPSEDIKMVKDVPTLFIASKADQSIPFSQTEIVFENCTSPKEIFLFEGDHLQVMELEKEQLLKVINKRLSL